MERSYPARISDKRGFRAIAIGKKYFCRNPLVDVKAKVALGFLGVLSVVSPGHGKDSVNQNPVDGNQFPEFRVFIRKDTCCLFVQLLKYNRTLLDEKGNSNRFQAYPNTLLPPIHSNKSA